MRTFAVNPERFRGPDEAEEEKQNGTATPSSSSAVDAGLRDRLLTMLEQRDVDNARRLLGDVHEDDLLGVLGAIDWYDERRRGGGTRIGPGLLVSCIREGGKPGYESNRGGSLTLSVTPALLASVRRRCLSPDGCRRTEIFDQLADAAAKRGLSVDALVDQAMGPRWQVTPPHPALIRSDEGWRRRYNQWLVDPERARPDSRVEWVPGESVLSWSMRYWRWEDEI